MIMSKIDCNTNNKYTDTYNTGALITTKLICLLPVGHSVFSCCLYNYLNSSTSDRNHICDAFSALVLNITDRA